jgi:response regulator RpfG family c-di-GMP phosphodiesterase
MSLKYKHHILIVDDEIFIINALKRIFHKEGYEIISATSPEEAFKLCEDLEVNFSLIISDQKMPKMKGSQFLEKIKKIFPDAIRFLLTGFPEIDVVVDAVNAENIHRYITKPWNDGDLLLQVRQSLEQYELVLENRRLLALTQNQNSQLKSLNQDLEKKVEDRSKEIMDKKSFPA